ncbi:hypothetical protein [Halalkalibacter alkaliphilus]|uniref:Uncharacterized protein n=1 Tax=Halalkalibacter alkaliphilus TaxID=2917993 RepID=A0A9X2I6T9_9BACI|nr:hypothetical protein [Halalkalibacter alkaliphilus]MCL7749421.1 hypothetical protein [Halalkalibacter alkaliphilus]
MKYVILLVSSMVYLLLHTSFPVEKTFAEKGYGPDAVIETSQLHDFQELKIQSIKPASLTLFICLIFLPKLATSENHYVTSIKHFLLAVFYKSNYFQNNIYSA